MGRRLSHLMNGVGLVSHHMATSFSIVSIITGKLILDRDAVSCTLPLLFQHLFSPLKYHNKLLYTIVQLVLEAIWEWETIWHLFCVDHPWNTYLTGWTMLCAHWLFLLAVVVGVYISAIVDLRHQDMSDGYTDTIHIMEAKLVASRSSLEEGDCDLNHNAKKPCPIAIASHIFNVDTPMPQPVKRNL